MLWVMFLEFLVFALVAGMVVITTSFRGLYWLYCHLGSRKLSSPIRFSWQICLFSFFFFNSTDVCSVLSIFRGIDLCRKCFPPRNPCLLVFSLSTLHLPNEEEQARKRKVGGRNYVCVCVYIYVYTHTHMKVKKWNSALVTQSCLTLCDPKDCGPPGSSVYGILRGRIREWVAISFSRKFSWPGDWTQVSYIAGAFFTVSALRETLCIYICVCVCMYV